MTRSWAESLCVMASGCLGVNIGARGFRVRLGLVPDVIVKLLRELEVGLLMCFVREWRKKSDLYQVKMAEPGD